MKSLFPDYNRAPSDNLQKLLSEGEFLAPLIALHGQRKGEYNLALDVHLRRNDEIHVYYGLTRLVTAKLKKDDIVKIYAAETYESHDRRKLFRDDWHVGEAGFQDCLDDYIDTIIEKVAKRWYAKEGRVQAIWSRVSMPHGPWTPFDREAVLDYGKLKNAKKKAEVSRKFSEVHRARSIITNIQNQAGEQWAKLPKPGVKPDQLAVDDNGNLVLLELKYAGNGANAGGVYYSPLQLLQYLHEWTKALESPDLWKRLQELVNIRGQLDLICEPPLLTGGIRAAVCFGDAPKDIVKRRFYKVLGVINDHRPSNVRPVETWTCDENGPQRLYPASTPASPL